MQLKYRGLGTYKRASSGRFDSFKAAVRRFIRFIIRWSLIGGTAYSIFLAGGMLYSTHRVEATEVNRLPEKLAALKQDLVSRLSDCERGGRTEADGLIVWDTNNKPSIGVLQFQTKTVQHYYKTLYQKDITTKEAVEIALDKEKAFTLATDVIFNVDKGINNWLNCANKHGLAAEVKLIKKLEQ